MVSAQDIPWEVIIFVSIFAIVLFYFIFFQGYLTGAIYRCIIRCFLPKNLSIDFKYIQFSILSGHVLIRNLKFTNLSMRVEISRLCIALKYWSKIPDFDENDKDEGSEKEKNYDSVEWIRTTHETIKDDQIKKKKGIFKTIFNRKSRFKVSIDGLKVTLFNQSEESISKIEMFRKIYAIDKKNTEEATQIFNELFPSPPPQAYQLSIIMRIMLPMTFEIKSMLITIGNPQLPSVLFLSSRRVKGIVTMLKKESYLHSLKQRLTFHMAEVKLRSVPNHDFDKRRLVKDSMRCLEQRFEKSRTILYTNVLNVNFIQDAFGCYIHDRDKSQAMSATVEPKMTVQIGIMSPQIEYGGYADKLRSAFMRYFKPFLFTNPILYQSTFGRVKYMNVSLEFFGDEQSAIVIPFTTCQKLNEYLMIKFDNKKESEVNMIIPQYVSTVEENKMEVRANLINTNIWSTLSNACKPTESFIIKSSNLLLNYMSFSPEKWYEKSISKCMITFENCQTKLAPYHIDFLTDLGTDFVSTYPFEPTIDDMDFFQPSYFIVSFKMIDAKIQLLSNSNPKFENIFKIHNHHRMVIKTPLLAADIEMPSLFFHENERSIIMSVQLQSPMFKFLLPNDDINQFRRNCYKWSHDEVEKNYEDELKNNQIFHSKKKTYYQDEEEEEEEEYIEFEEYPRHKYVKHEYLYFSSIFLSGGYNTDSTNGNRHFPLVVKIGTVNGLISVVGIKSILGVISNYSSNNKHHPNTEIHNMAFDNWVAPEPEFPDSIMHSQINVHIIKADVGIPFDLYDTSAYISLHAADFFLSVEGYSPFSHVSISLPSISITFNRTNFPSERFYYERIGNELEITDPQEVIHIDGINFSIRNCQVSKPRAVNLFSLLSLDIGQIRGTISIYQLFAFVDLALNFMHLWFSYDIEQKMEPDLDSIYFPSIIQVSIRDISLIVDFVQYGLMVIYLPSGIIAYQDNLINSNSHKAMFVNIPTLDVHHIYQPNEEKDENNENNRKKKKEKNSSPKKSRKSTSSNNNNVSFLAGSSTSIVFEDVEIDDNYVEEEEEEEEVEEIKDVAYISQLRSVFHLTTYVSIIRRSRYLNSDYDSKLQMKYLNEFDPEHKIISYQDLPKSVKLPSIFSNYDVTLDEQYTLLKTVKSDPDDRNEYQLPIHEIFFTNQNKYVSADVSQLWLHLFQIQRFSSFVFSHQNDNFEMEDPGLERFESLRKDMHVLISPNTTLMMDIEYIIALMLMMKTFNLHQDSHFLSSMARDVITDLKEEKILKFSNISLKLPGINVTLVDFNRESKFELLIKSINLVTSDQINVSNQMTLSVFDVLLNIYSKIDSKPALSLQLPSVELGKIDGNTSVHVSKINVNVPTSITITKVANHIISYILPIIKEIESPSVYGNFDDFKEILSKYVNENEDLNDYYQQQDQNVEIVENIEEPDKKHKRRHKRKKKKSHLLHKQHRRKTTFISQDEDTTTQSNDFLDDNENDHIPDFDKNVLISRYFLAYAKICAERKSYMNFVDNYPFDQFEHYDDVEEVYNENNIVIKANSSVGDNNTDLTFHFPKYNDDKINFSSNAFQLSNSTNANNNENNNNLNKDGIDNKNNVLDIKKTVIKVSRIQINFLNSKVTIKLDPISMISKGKDSGVRISIQSIKADLKSEIINFIRNIKKPRKEKESPTSAKFNNVKEVKRTNKFVIHFLLKSILVKLEFLILDLRLISALINLSSESFLSISLGKLLFAVDEYVQFISEGFDVYFSKKKSNGSFCLHSIGIKLSADLIMNPDECVDTSKFKSYKKRRESINTRKSIHNMNENLSASQKEKTEKLIQSVQHLNQSHTFQSLSVIVSRSYFFLTVEQIKLETAIDDVNVVITLPGIRSGVFNSNMYKAYLYIMKPQIDITNIIARPLFDVYMYGVYEPFMKDLNLLTTSSDLKLLTNKETLTKIATLLNNLFSKKKKPAISAPTVKPAHFRRKSVANAPLLSNGAMSSEIGTMNSESSFQKIKPKFNLNRLTTNACIVANTIDDRLKVAFSFSIPRISINIPEISSNLNLVRPSFSVKVRKTVKFKANIKDLDIKVANSDVSIGLNFLMENTLKVFSIDNLSIVLTPNLFKKLIEIKEFFIEIVTELTRQENLSRIINQFKSTVQVSVKQNVIKIFDPSLLVKRSKQGSNRQQYDIPTIVSNKFTINMNNSVINLKLDSKEKEEEEEENATNTNKQNSQDGLFLLVPSVSLSLETRKSESHKKVATAVSFKLKNLIIEDKNERGNSSKKNLSSVKCEETNIKALYFVNTFNIDVLIRSFHISLYSTIPFVLDHVFYFLEIIKKDIVSIKTDKIMDKTTANISNEEKLKMMARRGSLKSFSTDSTSVIFNVNIRNTAVILNSPESKIFLPSLSVYGNLEKTTAALTSLKLISTIYIAPIETTISPSLIAWLQKLLKNFQSANLVKMMQKQSNENANAVTTATSAPKKPSVFKLMLNVTFILEQIDFNLSCNPSYVMLLFRLEKFVAHYTSKTESASFHIGGISLTTDKRDKSKNKEFPFNKSQNKNKGYSYRSQYLSGARMSDLPLMSDNCSNLLSIDISPVDGLFSRQMQVFNINKLELSVSNKEMEDFFTFLKVWVEPLMGIFKEVGTIYLNKETKTIRRRNSHRPKSESALKKDKNKGQIYIIARVQSLAVSFSYSGVNGMLTLKVEPVLFSKTDLSTILTIPEIVILASGFIEGEVRIKPALFQLNDLNQIKNPSRSPAKLPQNKRLNTVILINSINCDINSYGDPLLFFGLNNISLFLLLAPPSDQILSLAVDSPKMKMTSQAIYKFKRIVASIADPIKEGIIKTKKATNEIHSLDLSYPKVSQFKLSSESSDLLSPEKLRRLLEKSRLDLLLEKLQVELYKYYVSEKDAVKIAFSRATLTVDLHEKSKEKVPETLRNMKFLFEPIDLSRLFCRNGAIVDQRSVLSIPEISGSLNTIQINQDVTYDFNTNFKDSVEASLTISDYETVRDIVMFAIKNAKGQKIDDPDDDEETATQKNLDESEDEGIANNKPDSSQENLTKKKFNFIPNQYQFSPPFKIALGAKIQPNVEWVLARLGITDEHIIPATLFEYVCISLQDLLELISKKVINE